MGALLSRVANKALHFKPEVAPTRLEDLPRYIDREFNTLGELVNKISEGELLPPVVQLPPRFADGTIKLFVPDNEGKLPDGIPKAGVYLYAEGDWYSFNLTKV